MNDMRDVRLTEYQMRYGADAIRRRITELERRLEKTSYAGKPGMKDQVIMELGILRSLKDALTHNGEQLRRAKAAEIRRALGL
jgi:hypothetical protein